MILMVIQKVLNDFNVKICNNYCKFNQSYAKFNGKEMCYKCSRSHEGKNCKTDILCCANCSFSNKYYGKNFNTNHAANDYKVCGAFGEKLKFTINQTHYPFLPVFR